jgi:hypothetical protein
MSMHWAMLFASLTSHEPKSSRRSVRDFTVDWVLEVLRVADADRETQEEAVRGAVQSGMLPAGDVRELRRAGWPV